MSSRDEAGEVRTMRRLHKITFVHYSQKDSKRGISNYVIASDEGQIVGHLKGDLGWEDWTGDTADVYPADDWWGDNPDAEERATALGLTIERYDYGDKDGMPEWVFGEKVDVCQWWREDPTGLDNLHYGATRFAWDAGVPITDSDAEVLVRLGIATDLTGTSSGEVTDE